MNSLKKLPKFIHQCMTIGEIPTSYKVSLTYEEQLMWFCRFLEEQVIPVVNNNSEVVQELKTFVETYFDNLDVQEEINNKLEEMVESGELQEIIGEYLSIKALLVFDNVSDMKNGDNLIEGSFVKTLGYYTKGDGGSSYYKIREITNADIVDEKQIIALSNSNTLIAEFVNTDKKINPLQFGAKGDGTTDDTAVLQYTFNYASTNHIEVFIPTPTAFYLISSGLNVPAGIPGIICEQWNYYGIIRPTDDSENYTMITIQPQIGFYCKNLSVGSTKTTAPTVNGILFVGHVGINIFEHIRVWNLNGYGFKINAIYDSVLTDISIEKCGNANEYAFSMNNDGDTCNMTTVNRLQCEQCNTKIISIADNTLNCVFNNIHTERGIVASGTQAFHFGGYGCKYNNIRLDVSGLSELATNIVGFSGTDNVYEQVRIESMVQCLLEGINGNKISFIEFRSTDSSQIREKANQIGKISFYDSTIGSLKAGMGIRTFNCKINNLDLEYMTSGAYSEFFDSEITNMTESSQACRFYATGCKIAKLLSSTVALIHLRNCIVTALTDTNSKIAYSSIDAKDTIFNTNITIDSSKVIMVGCTINGDLSFITGGQLFKFLDTYVSGTVASRYTSIPTTSANQGDKTENLKPTSGSYIGWVYTADGWKGYGAIA